MTNLNNRVLIVGLGSAGSRHLRVAQKLLPEADIRVYRHEITEDSQVHGLINLKSLQDLIEFAPQIAVIANPSSYHLGVAQFLADRGTHLLIEKPISSSLFGVQKLINTCNLNHSVLMVGYNLRYSGSLQRYRDLINSDLIGDIFSVRCEVGQYLPSWRPDTDYRYGVSAKKELGGGALLELSHELDYLRWIFGEIDWVSATLTRQSALEIDVEDSAYIHLGLQPRGSKAQFIASLNMDFIRQDQTRVCLAIGEKGSLKWDGIKGEVSFFESRAKSWKVLFEQVSSGDETYLAEWMDFIDLVSGSKVSIKQDMEDLRVMEVIESIRISSERRSQVAISEIQEMNWSQN